LDLNFVVVLQQQCSVAVDLRFIHYYIDAAVDDTWFRVSKIGPGLKIRVRRSV
jgi:hypothetical protein